MRSQWRSAGLTNAQLKKIKADQKIAEEAKHAAKVNGEQPSHRRVENLTILQPWPSVNGKLADQEYIMTRIGNSPHWDYDYTSKEGKYEPKAAICMHESELQVPITLWGNM